MHHPSLISVKEANWLLIDGVLSVLRLVEIRQDAGKLTDTVVFKVVSMKEDWAWTFFNEF